MDKEDEESTAKQLVDGSGFKGEAKTTRRPVAAGDFAKRFDDAWKYVGPLLLQ